MSLAQQTLTGDVPPLFAPRLLRAIGLPALDYLTILGGTYLQGEFLLDGQGRPIANDFINVVAAGRLALDGAPADAYDWPTHKQAEVRVIGHDFPDYYGWHYPPTFLFAAALATLPFLAAAIVAPGAGPNLRIGCRSPGRRFSAKAMPILAGCKACSGSFAPMAVASRWPGPCRPRQVSRSPSPRCGCGEAARRSISKPPRSPPPRLSRPPYVYMYTYDLVALAVAVAFLLRYGQDRGFFASEIFGLAAAGALILSFANVKTQVGLAAVAVVLALIAQRACCAATKSAPH